MHVVVIDGWKEETADLIRELADALGVVAFEARQRLIGGGPAAVAGFADPYQAMELSRKLNRLGIWAEVVDSATVHGLAGHFVVRRFELGGWSLRIESGDGHCADIPYGEIDLLLPGTCIIGYTESKTVTERKLSIGKTLLAGGIPMTSKVERQETVKTEERNKVLYLYAENRPQVLFRQNGMTYEGLGPSMKFSREQNFAYLTGELRRQCPGAVFDDRLLNRPGQARLLGPLQHGESSLDLAAEILARSLRRRGSGDPTDSRDFQF